MKIEELIVYGKKNIESNHAKILLANLLNLNPIELLNHLEEEIDESLIDLYKKEVEAVKNNKPIQYVIGNVNFYGNIFEVNENVLIPRFETEELVEHTINYINESYGDKNIKILDLCTGSGCIGLTIKSKLENSSVTLSDISKSALVVANNNKNNLNLDVEIIESNLFDNIEDKFDVIISNPPYIKTDEEIDTLVKENEPSLALYGGTDGLDFYRIILKDCHNYLNEKFIIAFEIGATQAEEISAIAKEYLINSKIVVKQDLAGKDRMIFVINQ